MSAIQDAIVELETERTKIDQALESLRLLQVRGVVPASTPATDHATAVAPPKKSSKVHTPLKKPGPHQVRVPNGGPIPRVVQALRDSTLPLSPREIRDVTGLTSSESGYALKQLADRKAVKGTGSTNTRRYSLNDDFEVVWSGSLERAAEVPSLVSGRDTRRL